MIGQARSGTWLTVEALNTIEGCTCAGELYHFDPSIRREMYYRAIGGDPKSSEVYAIQGDLEGYFYSRATCALPDKRALGLKVIFEHLRLPWARADVAIRRDSSIRIVHVIRDNPFDIMVSWWIACQERVWQNELTSRRIKIDPEMASYWLIERESYLDWVTELRKTHSVLEVDYLKLSTARSCVTHEMAEFLELPTPKESQPTLKKQDTRPLNEKIENFEEVFGYFKNTRWERYLSLN